MPGKLDLIGHVFGKLVVVAQAGKVKFGRPVQGWLCRCACGREEIVPQPRLTGKDRLQACHNCRLTVACRICGKLFLAPYNETTCSAECRKEARRQDSLACYHRLPEDAKKQRQNRRTERYRTDPIFAEQLRAQWRRKHEKMMSSPDGRSENRNRYNRWYATHSGRVLAGRAEREMAASPQEKVELKARRREYNARWIERIKSSDPQRYAQLILNKSKYINRWKIENAKEKMLAEFMIIGSKLEDMIDE